MKVRRSARSHIQIVFTLFYGYKIKQVFPQVKFCKISIFFILQPTSCTSTERLFFIVNYKKDKKNDSSPSKIRPLRAVVVQPVQFNSSTSHQKNSETVTIHVKLYWKCRTVKVPYKVLWFILSKYIKKVNPVIHSHTINKTLY